HLRHELRSVDTALLSSTRRPPPTSRLHQHAHTAGNGNNGVHLFAGLHLWAMDHKPITATPRYSLLSLPRPRDRNSGFEPDYFLPAIPLSGGAANQEVSELVIVAVRCDCGLQRHIDCCIARRGARNASG